MRAFESHEKPGSVNLLLSLPIPGPIFIFSKWLSGTLLLLGMLILTFPMVMTIAFWVSQTGNYFSGYLGASLLLASLYTVAVLAKTISRKRFHLFSLYRTCIKFAGF